MIDTTRGTQAGAGTRVFRLLVFQPYAGKVRRTAPPLTRWRMLRLALCSAKPGGGARRTPPENPERNSGTCSQMNALRMQGPGAISVCLAA